MALKNIPGKTVERKFGYVDRSLIAQAGSFWINPPYTPDGRSRMGDPHSDWKDVVKLDKVKRLLDIEALIDMQDEIQTAFRIEVNAWEKAENTKPGSGGKKPRLTDAQQQGEIREYVLPLAVDNQIKEYLKNMKWEASISRFLVPLLDQYSLNLDESDWKIDEEPEEVKDGDGGNDKKAPTV